ncbi:MAG TPA: MFS transporter [Galbitalea sp.]|jgi:EmrB/QacA subfamily drug resistance transporter|nr:MFS transporter [Galbitalea sp.]
MTLTDATPTDSPSAVETATPGRRRIPVWLAILAASIPMFMASLDNLVMTNALPVIHRDLGASVEQLQWFVNAYTLSFATFILLSVALADRFGRRTVFVIGITIFTVASVAAGFSTTPGELIAARAVQGVGGAALLPLSLTLLAGSVPARLRPLAIGIWGGVAGLGVALGPLIGGAVVEGWDWQAIFWINVPVGIIAVPLVLLALPNSFGAKVRADVLGVVLVGLGVLGIVFGIVRGNDAGWHSAQVLTGLIGGGVALIVFLWWETRTATPLIPLRLFRDRSFSVANIVGFGFSFGMFGSVFILIQFLQVVQGASPLQAAYETTPWTMAPMIVAPLAGIFAGRIGTRTLIFAGLVCQSVALFWLSTTMSATTPYTVMLYPFILAGIGMGLVFSPSSTAVLATMREQDRAKASGVNSTVREIGVALGIAVLVAVFTGLNGQLTPTGYVSAAAPAVLVGAGMVAATAIASLFLPSGKLPRKLAA